MAEKSKWPCGQTQRNSAWYRYRALMARARRRQESHYSLKPGNRECHHVIPRALGGGNEKSNLIYLTHAEHFRSHVLLTQFCKGKAFGKMLFALNALMLPKGNRQFTPQQFARARKAQSIGAKSQWQKRRIKIITTLSENTRARWRDPKYRAKMISLQRKSAKAQWQDPNFRTLIFAAQSASMKARWQDPKFRKKMCTRLSIAAKTQSRDPKFRKKMRALWKNPNFRAKMSMVRSVNAKLLWKDPIFRAKQRARKREANGQFIKRK